MAKEFTGAVDYAFPRVGRYAHQVFMLHGIEVTWSAAPTTAETLKILSVDAEGIANETELRGIDPSQSSLTDWVYLIPDGPLPLTHQRSIRITYPNTDGHTLKIGAFGYYLGIGSR